MTIAQNIFQYIVSPFARVVSDPHHKDSLDFPIHDCPELNNKNAN